MNTVIVDTNVPLVAGGRSEQASEDCVINCILQIQNIVGGELKLALDDKRRIIDEYRSKLNPDGQPTFGDAFLLWVETNWANPDRCDLVQITPVNDSASEFQEFPSDPALNDFDPDDRKFITVACAHPERPTILQAVDRRWWHFRGVFPRIRVTVLFICENDVQ
jgi:hypothetical protein